MSDEDLDKILDDIRGVDKHAESDRIIAEHRVRAKAPFLEVLAKIYMVIGYLIALGSVITLLYAVVRLIQGDPPWELALFVMFYAIWALVLLSISEGIKLFINIEANSRKQVLLLTKLLERKEGSE